MSDHSVNPTDSDLSLERLMTRLVDREATADDRAQFELRATAEPTLWRDLAQRLQDAHDLHVGVERAIAPALDVELPSSRIMPRRVTAPLAMSGWAAVLILTATWTILAMTGRIGTGPAPTPGGVDGNDLIRATFTPEDAYNEYIGQAPYVLGELEPMILDVEELSDGRIAVRFMRRIEEVLLLDADRELPVDETGALLTDPKILREYEREVRPLENVAY